MSTGTNVLNVDGAVYGAYGILESNTGTGANTVSIGKAGIVGGVNFDGIQLYNSAQTVLNAGEVFGVNAISIVGDGGAITNSGTVLAQNYGLELVGQGARIANSGTIDAQTGIAIYGVSGSSTDVVDNSGTINAEGPSRFGIFDTTGDRMVATNEGNIAGAVGIEYDGGSGLTDMLANQGSIVGQGSYGVLEIGAANLDIVNTGTIFGRAGAVNFAGTGTGLHLDNTGTIAGGVTVSGSSTLAMTNSGSMLGDVTFGSGNDQYDGAQGHLAGTVFGGGGDDVLEGGAGRDNLDGGTGNDVLVGGAGDDSLTASSTTTVTIDGGEGRDRMFLGGVLNAGDTVDGGSGNDTLSLAGDYSAGLVFSNDTVTNVERIVLSNGNNYNLTTNDDTVAAGATMRVDGSLLTGANAMTVDGSAETDGRFIMTGGTGNDVLIGGTANDWLMGGTGSNQFTGGLGADHIISTGSHEHFNYGEVAESTSVLHDGITGFNALGDVFDLDVTVSGIDAMVTSGSLHRSAFDANLAADIGAGQLAAGHAVVFTPTSGNLAGHTFLIVDANGVAGYQAGQDYVFDLVSPSNLASLSTSNFT
jgi:hypothetical protein